MEDPNTSKLDTIAQELERRKSERLAGRLQGRWRRVVLRRFLLLCAFVFAVLAGIFFYNFFRLNSDVIEGHVKRGLTSLAQGRAPFTVRRISGDLISGIEIEDLIVQNPHFRTGGMLLSVPRITLRYSIRDIFWGNIVLERLIVSDPSLVLARDPGGRVIWDFSGPLASPAADLPDATAEPPTPGATTAQAEAIADNYLQHIELKNLSLLIPRPRDLLPDQLLMKILRIPPGNLQLAGLNLLLRKYPHPDFISHVLRVSTPTDPAWLTMQLSRNRASGDVTASLDVLKRGVDLAVRSAAAGDRHISLFDRRFKDQMNVQFVLASGVTPVPERILGLNGIIEVDALASFAGVLSSGSALTGALTLTASAAENAPLVESRIGFSVREFGLRLPGAVSIERVNIEAGLKNRIASFTRFEATIASMATTHAGTMDFRESGAAVASFSSNLGGEPMRIEASWKTERVDLSRLRARIQRSAGQAGVSLEQARENGLIRYRNILLEAGIKPGGSLWDVLPLRILPSGLTRKIDAWASRVDLVGPLSIDAHLPEPGRADLGRAVIDLSGARVVSRKRPEDRLELGGRLLLSSGSVELASVSARLDSLVAEASGLVGLGPKAASMTEYRLDVAAFLRDRAPFVATGERVWRSFGLGGTPSFDALSLEGDRLLTATLQSATGTQRVAVGAGRVRLKRGRKSWWIDDLALLLMTDEPLDRVRGRPSRLVAEAKLKLFGFPGEARAVLDLARSRFDDLAVSWRGSDFGPLLAALREQPGIDAAVKRHGIDIGGAFALSLKGSGALNRPALSGSIACPRLDLRAKDLSAELPFDVSVTMGEGGEYRGVAATKNARITKSGVAFVLDGLQTRMTWGRPRGAKTQILALNGTTRVFDTLLDLESVLEPAPGRLRSLRLKGRSRRLQTLMGEIARIAKFHIPFTVNGPAAIEFVASGPFDALTSRVAAEVAGVDLRLPIQVGPGRTLPVDVKNISGKIDFAQVAPGRFTGSITDGKAAVADGAMTLTGRARLEREGARLVPLLDEIKASLAGIDAASLMRILNGGFLPAGVAGRLTDVTGILDGRLDLAGGRNRFGGTGELTVRGGGFRWAGIPQAVTGLEAKLLLSRRQGRPEPVVEWRDVRAGFGRSRIAIPEGRLIDPQNAARLSMAGTVEKAYPSDLLALLSGLNLPTVTFPKEGAFDGSVRVEGTLAAPVFDVDLRTESLELRYSSDGRTWNVPLGPGAVALNYDLGSGKILASKCDIGVLKGRVSLTKGAGTLAPGRPSGYELAGRLTGIDLGSLGGGISGDARYGLKGILGGEFTAGQTPTGSRDAVFQLGIENLVVEKIPIDEAMVANTGLDFLDEPEFTSSRLNLYVSSEGELSERGRVRMADALFAGPDMRLEISDSAFDPQRLELSGKIVFNPQPLRRTKLGRKMGAMTRVLQDKATGLPYLDLTVSGTWDRPELISKAILAKAKKRGKRNFIKSIFGGRRSHKASVTELIEWFPGWKPGQ